MFGQRMYHFSMGPLLLAFVLLALLIAVAVAFSWQERRSHREQLVVYSVEDALQYVMAQLSPAARQQVNRHDVRRILEWELRYLQDPTLRSSDVAVVGGLDAAQYAQEQALAAGYAYDGAVIIEVLDHQAAYLAELGAVGDPVDEVEMRSVIELPEDDI
jgi:hypothetical protein